MIRHKNKFIFIWTNKP